METLQSANIENVREKLKSCLNHTRVTSSCSKMGSVSNSRCHDTQPVLDVKSEESPS